MPKTLRRILILALVGAFLWGTSRLLNSWLGIEFGIDSLREFAEGLGPAGPLLFIGIVAGRTFFGLPSQVVMIVAGVCFGTIVGTAVGAVGLTFLPGQLGPFLPPFTTFTGAALQVPALTGRGVLFAQGLTIDTASSLPFHRISQPQPIYLAPSRSFWDRGVSLRMSRSFMPVIVDDNGVVVVPGGGLEILTT